MTFCMGERKQKGFLTVTLIALTDCHISSFTRNLLNTKNSDKKAPPAQGWMNTSAFVWGSYFRTDDASSAVEMMTDASLGCIFRCNYPFLLLLKH